MATGRTVNKYTRIYVNGYDLSGYARTIGPLDWSFETGVDNPLTVASVGNMIGQATISPGTLNAMFDTTATTGSHVLLKTPASGNKNVMVAVGIQAVPAQGDPAYCGQFRQNDYLTTPGDTPVAATVKFSPNSATSTSMIYANPWGVLLHANSAETGANSAVGVDNYPLSSDGTSDGGWMLYEVTAGAAAGGTANIKVQHADTNENADFADLLATGLIDVGTAPVSGAVALASGTAVKRYVRWQVALGTATSVTFALAFMRNYHI